jgi:hypothetical protein
VVAANGFEPGFRDTNVYCNVMRGVVVFVDRSLDLESSNIKTGKSVDKKSDRVEKFGLIESCWLHESFRGRVNCVNLFFAIST